MPKYYCDYCDVFLTHDTLNARRSHNKGWKHKTNVRAYYSQFLEGTKSTVNINKTQTLYKPPVFMPQQQFTFTSFQQPNFNMNFNNMKQIKKE
jgi:U1 small nuclear ribonucleoprotein C